MSSAKWKFCLDLNLLIYPGLALVRRSPLGAMREMEDLRRIYVTREFRAVIHDEYVRY